MRRLSRCRKSLLLSLIWTMGLSLGLAKDVFVLESRYDGGGWFHYRWRTLEDPFFVDITALQLVPWPFTNYLQSISDPPWTNYPFTGNNWNGLQYDWSIPQPRLNEVNFSVKSSSTHFRRVHQGFTAAVGLDFAAPMGIGWVAGGVPFDCLMPCAPAEADGSPPLLVYPVELIPDIKIDRLIVTNGEVYGLTFSWDEPSTMELQASRNMRNWQPITRIFGDPPQTTWTTNVSLRPYGEFFRLLLVANAHVTNAPASTTLASLAQPPPRVPIVTHDIIGNQFRIGFNSIPKATYEVECCELPGRITSTNRIVASQTFTTLLYDLGEPRKTLLFKARQLLP